jgi:hypothetical protein
MKGGDDMSEERCADFRPETCEKIKDALCAILEGTCSRVDISKNVKVYECKNVIRIDLKITASPEDF